MASNTTISRYRPALCVLAALTAGYTIYYVHSTRQASIASREPRGIRRRQANNRRRARPAQIEELISSQTEEFTAFLDYPQNDWDAKRLFDEWQACPDRFDEAYLLPQKHWLDREIPATILLRKELPSLSWLMHEFGVSIQDAQTILKDYEETMLRTFICQKVPPRCTLVDRDGLDMFTRAFSAESECLTYPSVIRSIIQLFNAGAYDYWTVRKDTYARFHVRPPDTRASDGLALEHTINMPVELRTDYANHPEDVERLDEPLDIADDSSESAQSWYEDDSGENKKEGPQTLLNMLYHIAEDQARREGFIHRGINCKNCNSTPIHGVRYKCINCVNYDLCETCEALQQHPKTHLFLKLRIPTPAYTNSKKPEALWYPGKTVGLPNNLKPQRNKQLSEDSGFNENEIEALWDQFKNLAATPWPTDPMDFCWAIDRETFYKCFTLFTDSAPRGHPTSLVYERLFRLYDSNHDGLIGFEEFINGVAAFRSRSPGKRIKRTFDGFDFDENGFISRKDVLAMFKACYALSKDLARDLFAEYEVDLLDGGSLRDNITGNQPISSAFTGMYESSDRHRRIGQGKTRDVNGDLIVTDFGGVLSAQNDDEGDLDQIVGDLKEISIYGNYFDGASDIKSNDNMQSPIRNISPGRTIVDASLATPPSVHLVDSHVGNNLRQHVTADEASDNENDRRWIFFENSSATDSRSNLERKVARDEAVTDRNSRARFYDGETDQQTTSTSGLSEPKGDVPSQTLDQDASNAERKLGTKAASLSNPKENAYNMESRIPPPMPEDIGQEMLFQITRECINELIDPLFRDREDLTLCVEHFKEFFPPCKDHVEIEKCSSIKNLAPELARKAGEALAWFHMTRYLKLRADNPNMFGRVESHPLIKFLQSMDEVGSPNFNNYMSDKATIFVHMQANRDIRFVLDHSQESLRTKAEASKNQPSQPNETETQPTPSLSSETSNPEESEIEYPAAAIELPETVSLFNENKVTTTLEENTSKQNLDNLLEESIHNIIADKYSKRTTTTPTKPPLDPTLPQNRPNSLPPSIPIPSSTNAEKATTTARDDKRMLLPKPFNPHGDQYIPPLQGPWTAEFHTFLRFLMVLERVHHDDLVRGGPGRINFREYSNIVGGAAASDLAFLGQWIDMQAI